MTTATNAWYVWDIPNPISTNALTRNVSAEERAAAKARGRTLRGRKNTPEYRKWRDEAGWAIKAHGLPLPHCDGRFILFIDVPQTIDLDNIKCIPDLLQWLGIIKNDRLMTELSLRQVCKDEPCTVRIRPVGEWS